jgi:hypothetical protein
LPTQPYVLPLEPPYFWQEEEEEEDWLAAAAKKQEHNQARLEAKEELARLGRREERLANIKARRAQVRIHQVEKNRDEFEELFKEVKWMKKAVDMEIAQVKLFVILTN